MVRFERGDRRTVWGCAFWKGVTVAQGRSFVPARHATVPTTRLKQNGMVRGDSDLRSTIAFYGIKRRCQEIQVRLPPVLIKPGWEDDTAGRSGVSDWPARFTGMSW